jgi:hypothetical protein
VQRLLPLAVRIQLLAQGPDLLLLRRGARGEGEGLEAARIVVSWPIIAHTECAHQLPKTMSTWMLLLESMPK